MKQKKNKKRKKPKMILTKILSLGLLGIMGWAYNTPTLVPGDTKEDPAIVAVMSSDGRGTGFFVEYRAHKYLITAAHVCGTSKMLLSEKGIHRILLSRPDKDICIATTYQSVDTLKIGPEVKAGDYVEMTGFPGDLVYDYQKGTAKEVGFSVFKLPTSFYGGCPELSSPEGVDDCIVFVTTIRLDILARPGNSGGPVQNASGEVVGIIIATNGTEGFMAPISELIGLFEGQP